MLNRLQPASRLLIRASLALFTAAVLLLIQSAFWTSRVSVWMQAIIFATALLSYFRPHFGLFALALLVPLAQVGSRTLDSQMRGAEALVLAFLAGALLRGWTLHGFRSFPSTRLETAALIFGFVVAASCAEQIWFMQVQQDFVWPFAQQALDYAGRNYLTAFMGFGTIFHAMLLLEGVALLLYAARLGRERPQLRERLGLFVVAGATGTAILTIGYVAVELFATGRALDGFVEFIAAQRWTVHVSDLNAAGSFFVMGMFVALGMSSKNHPYRFAWSASAVALAIAMLLTSSRTAVAAAGLVGLFLLVQLGLTHRSHSRRLLFACVGTIAAGAAIFLLSRTTGATPSQALTIRRLFLETTGRMLMAEPAFGVGVGQFSLWSRYFAPPELMKIYQPDNAHNNFAQIAGEIGFAGIAALLMVFYASVRRNGSDETLMRGPLLLGIAAFMLTWLGGHPLLVPEVAYPFWIAVGIVAASANVTRIAPAGAVLVVAALLMISLPFRVADHVGRIDLARVTYGLSEGHLMTSRARFFVRSNGSSVDVPLRARGASDAEPVTIEVFVDGSASQSVTLGDPDWRKARIQLLRNSTRRFHRIDLRVRPETIDAINPGRSSVEVGTWEIISKPHG